MRAMVKKGSGRSDFTGTILHCGIFPRIFKVIDDVVKIK
jgi:hypothetical protein